MRRQFHRLVLFGLVAVPLACREASSASAALTSAEKAEIEDSIRKTVIDTYDLTATDVVERLMRLYPDSGTVYSTSSGHIANSREELKKQIETFWQYVGSNMREPKWEWTAMHVDVISPDAAAMTASYRIPHLTPQNRPHVIAGAWTAVFVKRGGRWFVVQEHLSDVPQTPSSAPADSADHSGH